MGKDHDKAVTEHYIVGANTLEDGYWTDIYRETPYHENHSTPIDNGNVYQKGREVGECDILLVNEEDKTALYKEIKTCRRDLYKAEEQVERFEDFFEESEWDVMGVTVLEN